MHHTPSQVKSFMKKIKLKMPIFNWQRFYDFIFAEISSILSIGRNASSRIVSSSST